MSQRLVLQITERLKFVHLWKGFLHLSVDMSATAGNDEATKRAARVMATATMVAVEQRRQWRRRGRGRQGRLGTRVVGDKEGGGNGGNMARNNDGLVPCCRTAGHPVLGLC